MPRNELRMTIHCALFAALIIIGGYVSIPVGPVPIALADFFVMLAGLFLGFKYGVISTMLFLLLGILGLPVFAGGAAGPAVFLGPTGGFLVGYVLLAGTVGFISGLRPGCVITAIAALLMGNILMYAVGVPWLRSVLNLSWQAALAGGLTPFIPGAIIKIAAAVSIAHVMVPRYIAFNRSGL